MTTSSVAYCKIHPSIGVARVGNSADYYRGPEVPGRAAPSAEGGSGPYRDATGALLRMAAPFRVYGYDADDRVVGEITGGDDTSIEWTVHLANRKAEWYQFQIAMDIPEAARLRVPPRNKDVSDRATLVNDPGPLSICGSNASVSVEGGSCFGIDVPLGELRTDDQGRLLVLGGLGQSASSTGAPASTFANNDGWYDDSSDGPVDASVTIDGRAVPVRGAWVAVAPPDYAPGVYDVTTMWDIAREAAVALDPSLRPTRPSFYRDIYPIFESFTLNQWVNSGFAHDHGWGASLDFTTPAMVARLADTSSSGGAFQNTVLSWFRDPTFAEIQPGALPPMYGDAMDVPPANDPRQWMAITQLQYDMLKQWADGKFDVDTADIWPLTFDEIPLAEQPLALDRASLEACLGGPFHPGCEMTWPLRHPRLYEEPFRIKRRVGPEPDFGRTLDQQTAVGAGGPLDGSGPGDITRWMAVPWQTDTSSCLYAYVGWDFGLALPTFWPARVPNDLITEEQYRVIMDTSRPGLEREEAFNPANRKYWLRTPPIIADAGGSRLAPIAGEGWLAVGDAATAFDPLSSHGMVNAISTGLAAAKAAADHREGHGEALAAYSENIGGAFDVYLDRRDAYYAMENRWPASPFWSARRAEPRATASGR